MSRASSPARALRRALFLAVLAAVLPGTAAAQPASGRITGTVVSTEGTPLYGAQILVVGTRIGTLSDAAGRFVVTGVPAGAQRPRAPHTC